MKLMRVFLVFALAGALLASQNTATAQMRATPAEVQIGPIDVSQNIQGVPVVVPVTSFVSVETAPTGITVTLRTFANLGDLQAKIGSIVDSISLPHDNCRSYSANNPVVKIYSKKLAEEGANAVLTVSGDVDVWDCRQNPFPNTKLEWVTESWFGAKVRRPKIVEWPGDPIKNKLLTQPIAARLPASLAVLSNSSVEIVMGTPHVELGGQLAFSSVRDNLLNIFRINIDSLAERLLRAAIDPNKLKVAIPEEMQKLNLKIVRAQFINIGVLGVEIDARSVLATSAINDMLKALAEHKPT